MYHMTLKNIDTCKWFYVLPHNKFDGNRWHSQYKNGIKSFSFLFLNKNRINFELKQKQPQTLEAKGEL